MRVRTYSAQEDVRGDRRSGDARAKDMEHWQHKAWQQRCTRGGGGGLAEVAQGGHGGDAVTWWRQSWRSRRWRRQGGAARTAV